MHVISSMATRQVLSDLAAQFETQTGISIDLESVGGVDAARRVAAGEKFDVVILASTAIDALIQSGQIRAGSRVDLMQSGVAIAVREGAPSISISTEDDVKRAVLEARTLGYSTGPSGVYLAKLFERWGIAADIQPRVVPAPPGVPVGALVAKGEAELGFQQLSELLHVKGITILGPLPAAIQTTTVFSAGTMTASGKSQVVKQFLDFVNSPAAVAEKMRHGMMPAEK
ncbi:Aconitate Delta-isomerase [Bordetella tumbae]|uniref:substrate-binding domain-containing protein n=1 Tax=Bordetella tumbae TaxID=1649139 RepID=UPI0039EECD7B